MPIDWNEIRRRFDPWMRPTPQEVVRVYVRRPEGLTSDLVEYLGPEAPKRICLLVGQRSSGKTTELLRVMNYLQKSYLVVAVDLGALLPEDFGILDVLFAFGVAFYRTAAGIGPGQVERSLYTDLLAGMGDSVQKWVEKREAGISVPKLAQSMVVLAAGFVAGREVAGIIEKAGDKALEALSLKQGEASEIERHFSEKPRPSEVLRCLTAIIEALENKVAQRPLLLLADGLDVVHPAKSREAVQREDILSAIPCRAAVVAPPDLEIALDAPALQKVALVGLPNLPVTGPKGKGDLPALTLRFFDDLVARRLPEGLTRGDILEDEQLGRLARTSGGVIRDFIRMVHEACGPAAKKSKLRLDRDCVDHGINELAKAMGPRAMVEKARAILDRVATDHILPASPEALDLIHHNHVLLYRLERHTWYDVHPVVR